MLGKKSYQKSAKTRFLYSHENRDQKMGGGVSAKLFFQKQRNSASKKRWEKNRLEKVRKHFLYSHEYRDQKMGVGETRETIFPETRI